MLRIKQNDLGQLSEFTHRSSSICDSFAEAGGQFPLNAIGPKGQHAFVGVERMFFQGQTGLVSTLFGIPGLTATRVSTGTYRIQHPPAVSVDVIPGMQSPSGTQFQANIIGQNPRSGVVDIHILNDSGNQTGAASGFAQLINPPTGTELKMMFFVAPITPF